MFVLFKLYCHVIDTENHEVSLQLSNTTNLNVLEVIGWRYTNQ